MAKSKRSKKKSKRSNSTESRPSMRPETRHGVIAVIVFVVALFFVLSAVGLAGSAGDMMHRALSYLFGAGFFVAPLTLVIFGIYKLRGEEHQLRPLQIGSLVALGLSILALLEIGFADEKNSGGVVGNLVAKPALSLFDVYLSVAVFAGLVIISILIIFELKLGKPSLSRRGSDELEAGSAMSEDKIAALVDEVNASDPRAEPANEPKKALKIMGLNRSKPKSDNKANDEIKLDSESLTSVGDASYVMPPLKLLAKTKGKPSAGDIKEAANIIKRTLHNFRISVEIDEIAIGPAVARFAIKPAEGVKLSRIVGLKNDLALALAAHPIRIEAPIPGKSLVGIEIPNKVKTSIGLGSLLSEDSFQKSKKMLEVPLGKSVSNDTFSCNIAKMPHLLIAGATGSGKSATVHTILTSLLYKNTPEQLRLIMVDPKRVELTLYNGIPHLLTPTIKTPKKAILALKWAAKEMERRYDVLERESVRDITSYHKNIVEPAYAAAKKSKKKKSDDEAEADPLPEKMPFIVIVLDELADIMQAYPKELESAIVRLAQMSRAVGIHLILSTQRPEVNVITGLIKANVPGRIAMRVASQIDSRTILDKAGAEALLGAGDMLYRGGNMSEPVRMQCAFTSEEEVKKVVAFIKKNSGYELVDEINLSENDDIADGAMFSSTLDGGEEEDDLYPDAHQVVVHAGKASTSYLQRKLRVGYARAARLMDLLEERGVIGPSNGSKPREVLERPMDEPTEDEAGPISLDDHD